MWRPCQRVTIGHATLGSSEGFHTSFSASSCTPTSLYLSCTRSELPPILPGLGLERLASGLVQAFGLLWQVHLLWWGQGKQGCMSPSVKPWALGTHMNPQEVVPLRSFPKTNNLAQWKSVAMALGASSILGENMNSRVQDPWFKSRL